MLKPKDYSKRLCAHDLELWPADDAEKKEISIRLDWLEAPFTSLSAAKTAIQLRQQLLADGFRHAVVLGMGGSSLAPEVYSELIKELKTSITQGLSVSILDSTSPEQVLEKREELPLNKSVFIVSSKSGTTSEMEACFNYFFAELMKSGTKEPEKHFIAITDPGTPLEALGKAKGFLKVINSNPNVGGRYSALIEFGIVPAVLAGLDGEKLLELAKKMSLMCEESSGNEVSPGVALGIKLGEAYQNGRDKLTIIADPALASIGSWIEQLIAESSGKNGKGILPVANEPITQPEKYSEDRFFVYLSQNDSQNPFVKELAALGHPVEKYEITDIYQIGAEFLRWEIATAVVCSIIGVNAFNQPNVQLSKSITKAMISEFKKEKTLKEGNSQFTDGNISIFGDLMIDGREGRISNILQKFIDQIDSKGFVAINAFIARNSSNENRLQKFRKKILEKTGKTTTLGFGPRFLHSTGQLHKGGKNNGLFILITADQIVDFPIPKEDMHFGTLLLAQALGDMHALQQQNRHVLRIHFHGDTFRETDLTTLV